MKNIKKGAIVLLTGVMLFSIDVPVYAIEESSEKEEVVYIMMQQDGTIESMDVVNIFSGGNVVDYGDYTDVKMLTTNDKIKQKGDKITFSSSANRVYYQGTLENQESPWKVSIQYFLDGKKYNAKDIAGKSGALQIKIAITKNEQCNSHHFDNYALQATMTLDTEKCSNIQADGATLANVGSDKQLSYTVLPGQGLETSIFTDVEDFEMSAITINGIQLDLNVDIDNEELLNKVNELMDATDKLNSGAGEIYDGTESLKTGSQSLDDGIVSLNSGAGSLDAGINTLQTGVNSIQNGLDTLNGQSATLKNGSNEMLNALTYIQSQLNTVSLSVDEIEKLTSSSMQIKQGITDLHDGITSLKNNLGYNQYKTAMKSQGLDIDNLKASNQQTIETCQNQITALKNTINTLIQSGQNQQAQQLQQQVTNLENIVLLLSANNAAIGGTEAYLNSVSSGVDDLDNGVAALEDQYEKFDGAIVDLSAGLMDMMSQMSTLTSGINQLVASYQELNQGIGDYTDGVAYIVSGYKQMVSGVSNLAGGSKTLLDGSRQLSAGSSQLYNGIVTLNNGAKQLSDGTNELHLQTSSMDTQVEDEIDNILSSLQGNKTDIQSFVSTKNTKVKSVQFVMKTKDIKKAETKKKVKKEEKEQSLWQKFMQLFGF